MAMVSRHRVSRLSCEAKLHHIGVYDRVSIGRKEIANKARDFLPSDKQYLITRNGEVCPVPAVRPETSVD